MLATMHAQTAMSIVAGLASTPDMRDRRAVLRALTARTKQREYASVGELTRDSKLLVPRVRLILQTLCLEGYAVSVDMPGVTDGKQQPNYYRATGLVGVPQQSSTGNPVGPPPTPAPVQTPDTPSWLDEEGYVRTD